jgi:hypothetical protein
VNSGHTEVEARSILEDVDGSDLIDASQKAILHFTEKVIRHAYKITETGIELLREKGLGDNEILEVVCIIGWYNMFNRIVMALGLPVEEIHELFFWDSEKKPKQESHFQNGQFYSSSRKVKILTASIHWVF